MVIRNFGCVNGFVLGSIHVSHVVWYRLVVDSRLGGCGELGAIVLLVIHLIRDKEAQQIVDYLLHIVRER